jgi:hypothetical protein
VANGAALAYVFAADREISPRTTYERQGDAQDAVALGGLVHDLAAKTYDQDGPTLAGLLIKVVSAESDHGSGNCSTKRRALRYPDQEALAVQDEGDRKDSRQGARCDGNPSPLGLSQVLLALVFAEGLGDESAYRGGGARPEALVTFRCNPSAGEGFAAPGNSMPTTTEPGTGDQGPDMKWPQQWSLQGPTVDLCRGPRARHALQGGPKLTEAAGRSSSP